MNTMLVKLDSRKLFGEDRQLYGIDLSTRERVSLYLSNKSKNYLMILSNKTWTDPLALYYTLKNDKIMNIRFSNKLLIEYKRNNPELLL